MTRRELIDLCLFCEDTYEDYPFDKGEITPESWAVIRHKSNKKIFAAVFEHEGKLLVNVKCDPMRSDFLRGIYRGITPAWHMNKVHWISIDPHADVPQDELEDLIFHSFKLTGVKTGRGPKA